MSRLIVAHSNCCRVVVTLVLMDVMWKGHRWGLEFPARRCGEWKRGRLSVSGCARESAEVSSSERKSSCGTTIRATETELYSRGQGRIAMRAPREILARCLRMQTAGCFKSSANDVRVKAAAQAA